MIVRTQDVHVADGTVTVTEWDTDANTVTVSVNGEPPTIRPMTAAERDQSQQSVAADAAAANDAAISRRLLIDMNTMQAIINQTDAAIADDPSQQIKDLARVTRRLIRRVERLLDGSA